MASHDPAQIDAARTGFEAGLLQGGELEPAEIEAAKAENTLDELELYQELLEEMRAACVERGLSFRSEMIKLVKGWLDEPR